jgi:hypothetical protein
MPTRGNGPVTGDPENRDEPTWEEPMTTAPAADSPADYQPADQGPARPPYGGPARPGCDPDLLDSIPCETKGIAARAQYNKDHETALTEARTQYDAARGLYTTARATADPLVDAARQQLDKLLEQLDCLIDADERHKVEQAWEVIREELEANATWGCYRTIDCDFEDDVQDCPVEDIPARIADITRRVGEAENFFAELIQEPARLADRVSKVQAEIADIDAKVKAGPAPEDLPGVYAKALVAGWHLDTIWGGFGNVDDYMDCLCGALTCSYRGHAAISELVQQQAVEDCQQQSATDHLTWLREHTAEAVMAEYQRMAAGYGDGGQEEPPKDGGGYGGGGQEEPPKDGGGYGGGGQEEPPKDGGGYGDGGQEEPPKDGGGYGDGGQEEPPKDGGGYGDGPQGGRYQPTGGAGQGSRYRGREGSGGYRNQPGGSRA